MKLRELLNENLSFHHAESIVHQFVKFVKDELNLEKLPTINLIKDQKYSIENHSFGGYRSSDKSINVMISNRHIQDVLRTIGHELVHYKQDIKGQLKPNSGDDGSPEENEANSTAGILMRKWGKMNPSIFGKHAVE